MPRVAVVTGAASGIGRHWAGVLARAGEYQLALCDVDEPALRTAFTPGPSLSLHAFDVRSVEGLDALVDDTVSRWGRIDYLFNIAGGGRPGFLLDVPLELVDTTIDVNLKGQIYGMRLVGAVMARQRSGHIVNMSSLAGIPPRLATSSTPPPSAACARCRWPLPSASGNTECSSPSCVLTSWTPQRCCDTCTRSRRTWRSYTPLRAR